MRARRTTGKDMGSAPEPGNGGWAANQQVARAQTARLWVQDGKIMGFVTWWWWGGGQGGGSGDSLTSAMIARDWADKWSKRRISKREGALLQATRGRSRKTESS
jgi:hypothetical protein